MNEIQFEMKLKEWKLPKNYKEWFNGSDTIRYRVPTKEWWDEEIVAIHEDDWKLIDTKQFKSFQKVYGEICDWEFNEFAGNPF
jgi:hypothetical protein